MRLPVSLAFGLVLSAFVANPAAWAEDAAPGLTLTVTITGLGSADGQAMVALFNQEDSFLKDPMEGQVIDIADDQTATTTFEGLAAGPYAVSVIHDENGNGKVDTNFIGIPKEPVGVSNNPKPRMGPPRYKDAVFDMTSDHAITITMGKAK